MKCASGLEADIATKILLRAIIAALKRIVNVKPFSRICQTCELQAQTSMGAFVKSLVSNQEPSE